MTLLIAALLLMSCDVSQAEKEYGTLTINFSPEGNIFERTVNPEGTAPLDIDYYKIRGTSPDGRDLTEVRSDSNSITINNLKVGKWDFYATAYNAVGKRLATGAVEGVYIHSNMNTINMSLDTLVGKGTMNLGFTWATNQVTADTLFSFTLSDNAGTDVHSVESVSAATGSYTVNKTEIPAGFYTFQASLIHDGVQIAGYTENIRIIEGTTSSAAKKLVIGMVVDQVNMEITDGTDKEITGAITSSVADPTVGGAITLTYALTTNSWQPQGDLVYQWYVDGKQIEGAESATLDITAVNGITRYDVIVGTTDNPALGSATIDIKIIPTPGIENPVPEPVHE